MLTRIFYSLIMTRYNTISNWKCLTATMIGNSNTSITHINTFTYKFTSMFTKIYSSNTIHLTHHCMSMKFYSFNRSIIHYLLSYRFLYLFYIFISRSKSKFIRILIHSYFTIKVIPRTNLK